MILQYAKNTLNQPQNSKMYVGDLSLPNQQEITIGNFDYQYKSNERSCSSPEIEIYLSGEIYSQYDNIKNSMQTSIINFLQKVEQAYRLNKLVDLFSNVDGIFVIYIYDKSKKRVLVITDRHGLRMHYWGVLNGVFSVADNSTDVAQNIKTSSLNHKSFKSFYELGFLMGEHTLFSEIKLCKPATIMTFDLNSEKVNQKYYWTWAKIKYDDFSFDDAVDELGSRFIQSVKKRFNKNEKIGVSLSGGLDSRAIIAAINYFEPDYEGYAYTFGVRNSSDYSIAAEVTKRASWRHDFFEINAENWLNPRLPVVINTDGMYDIRHMHGVEFSEKIKSNIDINLNGYLGDVVAGGGWINEANMNQRANSKNLIDVYGNFSDLGFHIDEYFDIENREPALYLSRARRFTNMGIVAASQFTSHRLPFFDNCLLELLMGMPDEFRFNNKLYSKMLLRFFPKFFRDIPWQKTGKIAGIYNKNLAKKQLLFRLRRKVSLILSQKKYFYTDYPGWVQKKEFSEFINNINKYEKNLVETYLSGPKINDLLKDHKVRKNDLSDQILRLVTLEIYLTKIKELDIIK
jgi:asparagine synthase (glutamine-hydrolysing)